MPPLTIPALAARLTTGRTTGRPLLIGLTGSVAAGKSTLAAALAAEIPGAATVSTDGFLKPNAELEAAGLLLRKGFPESYDAKLFAATLAALRQGPARIPGYSHLSFDIDPALVRTVGGAVIIVEGLGFNDLPPGAVDTLVYLDAEEDNLLTWYTARFFAFWRAAHNDPTSFYTRFLGLTEAQVADVARQVWTDINLPNLRQHISAMKPRADVVLRKAADHSLHMTPD